MKKILVIGCPGSGKSTFSKQLHKLTGIPLYHLDMMYWNADKTTVDKAVFLNRLTDALEKEEWIIDGNYSSTMELRIQACDTVFLLDYPLDICLEGINNRQGKPRSDIPWTDTEQDSEFIDFIKNFNRQSKPQIINLLSKYSDKEIHIFKSRNDSEKFLKNLIVIPDYYSQFKCIADKCQHSCCIGWEIEIDDNTIKKYNNILGPYADKFKENIDYTEVPYFILGKNERCPFLKNDGLCEIISDLGEDMLCQICSDHPRFRNYYSNHIEIGLGLCCEAAATLILSKKDKVIFSKSPECNQSNILKFRQMLFDTVQDRTFTVEERIDNMLILIGAKLPNNFDWYSIFNCLERLDNKWSDYLLYIKNGIETDFYDNSLDSAYEQLIVYLLFRHFSDCQYDEMITQRILYSVLIYKMLRSMNKSNTLEELIEIARLYSCEIEYSDENLNKILKSLS